MQKKKTVWYIITLASVFSLLLLGSGAVMALKDSLQTKPKAKPPTPQQTNTASASVTDQPTVPATSPANIKGDFRIVALGDSLTRGTGDETGEGYVGYLSKEIQKTTKAKVVTSNLGVNGMQSPELLEYIKSPDVQKEIKSAHLITLSIGGNDLTHGVGAVTAPNLELANKTCEGYLNNLDQILQDIRKVNGNARILFVGLYNPFPLAGDNLKLALNLIEQWNTQTSLVLRKYPGTVLIPTQDLFNWNADKLLADDRFHPNSSGYKAIAQRMIQDL